MDTDSNYLVASAYKLEEVIKPERLRQLARERAECLADPDPDEKYLKHTPGIFKLEYKGPRTMALCSKCYFAEPDPGWKKKINAKGMSKPQNALT